MLKRFESSELGETAGRRVSYHCTADYAKSSKATCRVCHTNIEQNELRLALMLQDEEGYKSTTWTHFDCFWKHPETPKLDGIHEVHNRDKLKSADRKRIAEGFEKLKANPRKRRTDDSEDDDYSTGRKSTANKTKRKKPASKKTKRELNDE